MANNKQIGAKFEREFVEILAKKGFWAHFLAPSPTGAQPFDVIAMVHGCAYCFDCKTSVKPIFPITRLEDNQMLAFDKWLQCGGHTPYVAVKYDNKIYLIEYTRLRLEGSVDLRIEDAWHDFNEEAEK